MSSRQSSAKQSSRKTALAATRASNGIADANGGRSSGGGELNGSDGSGNAADNVDSRRLKKRELDRRCQRMARERTKQRIAYLEELVDNFRKQDASGQIANLMKQLTDVQKERDELSKTLKTIANSIRGHETLNGERGDEDVKGEANSDDAVVSGPPALPSSEIFRIPSLPASDVRTLRTDDDFTEAAFNGSADEVYDGELSHDVPAGSDEELIFEGDMASPEVHEHDPVYPKPAQGCDCCPPANSSRQPNLWRYACEALGERPRLSTEVMKIEDAYAEDIPVRAILDGWDATQSFYGGTLPPLWQKLRTIDEIVFHGMKVRERLACLRVMHLLYSYHSEPTFERRRKLPQWYLKRPSQTLVHSYAIDFFAWPGIRERFVFAQHRYCSNTFWHLFNSCLNVLWPYEFRDCYSRNATTGNYSISSSFEKRLFDINAWTMGDDMFKKWPEFYSDFPASNRLPMTVSTAGLLPAAKMPKVLPEPDSIRRSSPKRALPITTAVHHSSIATTTDSVPDEDTSIPRTNTSVSFAPQIMVPLTNGVPASSSAALYSMAAFDDWWGPTLPFAPPPPQQQQQQQAPAVAVSAAQQQQQHAVRDLAFQALDSRPDHMNGMYGLTF